MNLLDFINDLEAKEAEEKEQKNTASVPMAPPVLSVSQVSSTLKNTVEQIFAEVKVEGEVSGFKQAASGHMYFNLKDDKAVLNAVVWRGTAAVLAHHPAEGQQVIATGRLTTYPARSYYQITINHLEPAGQGTLLAQLEALKKKLFAEGLFDEDKKQEIPYLPKKIGIITSPTGAVIDDMLHRISARCPRPVILAGVAVQGVNAATEIVSAIQRFNALSELEKPDVLILARGGGSLEDLMAFNDEKVVRALAESSIPTISGVGHEPDTTLCDYAADKRAPTPTAAAEFAVPVRADLEATLNHYERRLPQSLRQRVQRQKEKLVWLGKNFPDPRQAINQSRQRLDDIEGRLARAMQNKCKNLEQKLSNKTVLLENLSPQKTLKRGYIYATDHNGEILKSAMTKTTKATLHFHDGERLAELKS